MEGSVCNLRRVFVHPAYGFGFKVRQARASGFEPDLLQYGGNIFAIGLPTSFAFAELSAARQQAIGVFSFVACCFADFIQDPDPLFSVGRSVHPAFGADVFVCSHSGHCFHSFILATVSSIWQTGCKEKPPAVVDSVRYDGKPRG